MSIDLRPLRDNLVVEPIEEDERTAAGIILPETAKEKPQRGLVVAVGPGKLLDNGERQSMAVKVGDRVLYAKYSGTEVTIGDRDLLVLSQGDVLAVLG